MRENNVNGHATRFASFLRQVNKSPFPRFYASDAQVRFPRPLTKSNSRQSHVEKVANPHADPLPVITNRLAKSATVLFLDEFQVTDIADAMILRRLLTMLLARGMVLVTTSNRHPRDLYRNGIQRESFIPAIELLQSRLRVINLDSPTDYRKIPRPSKEVYFSPVNKDSAAHANKWFEYFGGQPTSNAKPAELELWGRKYLSHSPSIVLIVDLKFLPL